MSETIIAVVITSGLTLVGIIISSVLTYFSTSKKINFELDKQQSIMATKIEELTREVREHNNFARRMPVVEEQIKVINHRIEDLERKQ